MAWQLIETAPKDGTQILAWSEYLLSPVTVFWSPNAPNRGAWKSCWECQEVIDYQSDFGTQYKDPNPLSHWMPLPSPPTR